MKVRGFNSMVLLPLLCAALLAARAEAREDGFVVSSDQVADAMNANGVSVPAEQIEFLSPVRARQANPTLKLITVGQWQEGVLKAEMRCVDQRACLPFYVLVHDAAAPESFSIKRQPQENSSKTPKHYDVHNGDAAILVIERDESRITMRVICAQDGERGHTIRVKSADHKRIYQAQVVAPGLLKGTF